MPRTADHEIEAATRDIYNLLGSTDARNDSHLNDVLDEFILQCRVTASKIRIAEARWTIRNSRDAIDSMTERIQFERQYLVTKGEELLELNDKIENDIYG